MRKKRILLIICLLVVTGCGKSNQLEVNNKIKDTLVYHEKIDEEYRNSDLMYSDIVFNFDKNNKLISISMTSDWDYSKTPYNIEVLKKGIETKNDKCKYGKSNVTIKNKSQNVLRFNYLTDIQKIREDLKNTDDKEKFYDNLDEERSICGIFPIMEETEEYLEYGKEKWEELINSEMKEDDDASDIENYIIKTDGSYDSDSGSIMWVKFSEDKEVLVEYDTGCTEDMPCGGYAEKGTYVIEGNKIKATLTKAEDIEWYELDKSKELTFTIINENQIETDTQIFNYR